jgi:hypothetical protein
MAKNRFNDLFEEADADFTGQYKEQLDKLHGMSKDEINSIIPGTTGLQAYEALIKVVEEASKKNLTQAQLIKNIKELGDLAVKLAKKIPEFAALL